MIVYICIGNSDDKLSQAEWVSFIKTVDRALGVGLPPRTPQPLVHVHGRWFSAPDVSWQSACWCIEFDYDRPILSASGENMTLGAELHLRLALSAGQYRQDSIAWAQTPYTELIRPPLPRSEP